MSPASSPCKIFTFQDTKCSPDPVFEVKPECLHPSPVPIVVDNGSFQTRAGWACKGEEFALPGLLFKSVAARSRGAARSETQVGNDIPNLEPLRWLLKGQFDRNVVVNFEIQELMLDYIFVHLGIGTEVRHELVYRCTPSTSELFIYLVQKFHFTSLITTTQCNISWVNENPLRLNCSKYLCFL